MPRPLGRLLIASLICLSAQGLLTERVLAQKPPPAASQPQAVDADPTQLLIKSYLSGHNLPPELRTYLLTLLSYAAVQIEPSLTRLWAQEAFQLAFTLPMSWDRVAHEKNSLAALAQVDPILAFKLFDSMDTTVPLPSGDIPEDLRAYAARTVFQEYWKREGPAALDVIRRQAARLGDTGQYPFLAMAPIIRDVDRENPVEAQALFGEALTYYGRGWRTASTDEEFSRFLQELWNAIPLPLKRQALQRMVGHLTEESEPPHGQVFLSRAYLEKGTVEFRSRAKKLLYSLLPQIREVDPRWASQLVEADPALQRASAASGSTSFSEQLMIHNTSGVSSAAISALQAMAFQRQKLVRIAKLASTDPSQALALSDALTDRALRAQALAVIAAGLGSKDPGQARSLIDQVRKDLESIGGAADRVAVLVALAKAAAATRDQKLIAETLERGFDLGEELFSEDLDVHPGKAVEDVTGFDSLSDLTAVGVKYAPEYTVPRIERISNDLLRAHLLMITAENLFEARRAAVDPH